MTELAIGAVACHCDFRHHRTRLIVLTGGPSAGKTAVLHTLLRSLCRHLAVLPESASIVFGGGFPRRPSESARRAAQRAIYHVQREVEQLVSDDGEIAIALCDRGTLDGLAYWPHGDEAWFAAMGTTLAAELERYAAVIHLQTPSAAQGYDASYALRVESPSEALVLDAKIAAAWSAHPRRFVVESTDDFLVKLRRAVELVFAELPPCCQRHAPAEAGT